MSDTLREELKTAINRWRAVPAYSFHPEKFAGEIDTILAAYPADTETEWGVMRADDETVIILSSRETACELILSDERIVSRQVTPWEVSK